MPRKDTTITPQKIIDEAVKRHMAGESVDQIRKWVESKGFEISRAGFYLWVAKYKRNLLENASKETTSPKDAEKQDKRTLVAQIEALKLENRKLRDKVVTLMIKAGEI